MKVCFFSLSAYSLFNPDLMILHGGAEIQLYQLANKLAEDCNNYSVSFIVGNFGQKKMEKFGRIDVFRSSYKTNLNGNYGFMRGFFSSLFLIWTIFKINPEVVIQRAAGIETGLLAFIAKILKKKFIHMTANSPGVDGSCKKIWSMVNIFYNFGIRNADIIITQSEEHKKLLNKNYKKDSIVIKNSFMIGDNFLKNKENGYILWVSNARLHKRPKIFLELAKKMPEEKFVMIMPKHNLTLWDSISKETKKISNLTFIERVPYLKIDNYFKEAKLFVNTSEYEGFPNTFVQACINKTPIISLEVDPDNFLEKYHCGFCCDGNINLIVNKINILSKNNVLYREYSDNARSYSLKNHDIVKNIEEIKKIINKII